MGVGGVLGCMLCLQADGFLSPKEELWKKRTQKVVAQQALLSFHWLCLFYSRQSL